MSGERITLPIYWKGEEIGTATVKRAEVVNDLTPVYISARVPGPGSTSSENIQSEAAEVKTFPMMKNGRTYALEVVGGEQHLASCEDVKLYPEWKRKLSTVEGEGQ